MSDDRNSDTPPGHSSPGGREQPGPGSTRPAQGDPPVLDLTFDSASLYRLRAAVSAYAHQAGMPAERTDNAVIAVHELAANAIRHGAGRGRARLWLRENTLWCEVTDDGMPGHAHELAGAGSDDPRPAPWPIHHERGLWVVHRVADHFSLQTGTQGTTATISFALQPAR